MTAVALVELVALAAVAAYVQTLTGFALGLVVMGGIGLTGLLPLPDAAVLVSVLTLFNALVILARGWRDVAWTEFALMVVASTETLVGGYMLLEVFAGHSIDVLRLILAAAIIASSVQLLVKPHPLPKRSPGATFVLFGCIAGVMGGLFSTSGPPLVYHMYRQPLPHAQVRGTLVLVFAINAINRLAAVSVAGSIPPRSEWWALLAVPAVVGFSYAARRWPPPLSQMTLRRGAFLLLMASGLSLGLPALVRLLHLG